MVMMCGRRKDGFTIVELLIVVVVIAILAAITLVSYTGIQERAVEAKVVSMVDGYRKAFMLYATKHNSYPTYSDMSQSAICLGSGYPVPSGATRGACVYNASGSFAIYSTDPATDPLNSVASSSYDGSGPSYCRTDGICFVRTGLRFVDSPLYSLDGAPHPYWMAYIVLGRTSSCPIGPVATNELVLGTGTSAYAMTSVDNDFAASSVYMQNSTQDYHECWVPLPMPAGES